MKATEIRIGNLVKYMGREQPVTSEIIRECELNNATTWPIPLTEERLIEMGFTKNDYSATGTQYDEPFYKIELEAKGWLINWDSTFGWFIHPKTSRYNVIPVKSVHQLQNLYFALTGEELTPITK